VLRVLDQTSLIVDMQDLGFEKSMMDRFQRILSLPHGIILLTGPTGSGKTTTLYSALNYLRSPERNIQTVEDPVEYLIPGINQMATRDKVGLDFARSLRSILRQDPDIIMVGEVRDVETARIAIRAALTGHLVLSTLHTNDAPSAFSRLRDIGVEGYLTAATVNLVISQRLVRKICPNCSRPVTPDADQLQLVTAMRPEAEDWTFRAGAGCEQCGHSGYRGRTAVLEFLEVSDAVRSLVLNAAGDSMIRDQALEQGMEPLAENGLKKVEQGITTLQEIVRVWPLMVYA
jgi:type II secretory ATPase GspE/PulE/Tfp pilus assembly ATPase PilB-like protein